MKCLVRSYQLLQTRAQKKNTDKKQKTIITWCLKQMVPIYYMNKQHKGHSTMENTFHLRFRIWDLCLLFSARTLTMLAVSACFVLKSTKYLTVFVSTACDCAVCFLKMSTSSLSAEAHSLSTDSSASRASTVGNSWCTVGRCHCSGMILRPWGLRSLMLG